MFESRWIKLICTVGPASLKPGVLGQMERLGVDLLRINLSHTSLEQMEEMIRTIRASCALPLCVDTEGAQIRTGRMADGTVKFRRGRLVRLTAKEALVVAVGEGPHHGFAGRTANGVSLTMLADLLLEFGAVEAINLDGGGSTTMVIKNKLVNKPSDATGERPVSDAILVYPR